MLKSTAFQLLRNCFNQLRGLVELFIDFDVLIKLDKADMLDGRGRENSLVPSCPVHGFLVLDPEPGRRYDISVATMRREF